MGLLPTTTHSFDVNELWVDEAYSFVYNRTYIDQPIFKVPFSIFAFANELEEKIGAKKGIEDELEQSIHNEAVASVKEISAAIVEVYPLLGIKASRRDTQLNQIFRDYFTATQHYIFADR